MARDTELRKLRHLTPREQLDEMGAHDAGDAHEQALLARDLLGQAHQARQDTRHLDDGHLVGTAKGIDTFEAHDEVQRLVGHLGEWMGWVQAHGHEQRLDFAQEVLAHPFALGAAALAMGYHAYALPRKGWNQRLVVQRVLAQYQLMRLVHQRAEALQGVQALGVAGLGGRHMRGATHLEPFVEIRGDDAQIAQTLQQRHIFTHGPVQHALIEGQDAMVTVKKLLLLLLHFTAFGCGVQSSVFGGGKPCRRSRGRSRNGLALQLRQGGGEAFRQRHHRDIQGCRDGYGSCLAGHAQRSRPCGHGTRSLFMFWFGRCGRGATGNRRECLGHGCRGPAWAGPGSHPASRGFGQSAPDL
ncbi:MAG: hypothetical protein GAK34_02730 [Delftia tsuruhatensis]|nr:MAG: hypothetical protein GAK34_02730 [Delftia tsuruhatensis]